MDNKRRRFIAVGIIFGSLSLVVGLPLAIDWMIIGNSVPSNITNDAWVDFLGGYIGSLIGAVVSLLGIIITIRYTNTENKLDRELQVRPYCAIRYVPNSKGLSTNKILGTLPIVCEPRSNNGSRQEYVIYFKNVGLGPAIEFKFSLDPIDDGREHCLTLMQRTPESMNNAVNLLQVGEEAAFPIIINFNFDPISEDNIQKCEGDSLGSHIVNPNVMNKYKNFKIGLTAKYKDLFQNEYSQKITLGTNMYISIKEGTAFHQCDIHLLESTIPTREKTCNGVRLTKFGK